MAATYEIIAAQLLRINVRNDEAWHNWGVGLFNEALTLQSEEATMMFAEAARKFAVACDLDPRESVYWVNFADALYQQGLRSPDDAALPLLREAGKAYGKAIRQSPRRYDSWISSANCFREWANRAEPERRESLYHAAYVRFSVATELDVRNSEAWMLWVNALFDHLRCAEVPTVPRLAMQTAMICERAATVAAIKHDFFCNGAVALLRVVDYLPDAEGVDGWLADAYARLTEAISHAPDFAPYWRIRAGVLLSQARRVQLEKRDATLADADAQCAIAHRIAPEDYEVLLYWGNICADRARSAEDAAVAITYAREATAKYEAAAKTEPNSAFIWGNWAIVCHGWAYDEPEHCAELLTEASEKFLVAERFDAENPHLLCAWSDCLRSIAKRETDENAAPLLAQAEEKARKALEIVADFTDAYTALCGVGIRRADRETDPERRAALFAEAIRYADEADAKRPGVTTYNRAVIAALTGDEPTCEKHLREALRGNHVSNRRRVRADEDFASVQNAPWFRELFGTD